MHSHFLKKFIKETLYFSGCRVFLNKWNNESVVTNIAPTKQLYLPPSEFILHKCKKKFCPHKILANFKITSTYYNRAVGYRNHASIFSIFDTIPRCCLLVQNKWNLNFWNMLNMHEEPMYKICWKPTIKAQERGDWCCSGVFIISFRGVGIQDLVEYLRWSFFCNSIDKS